MKIQTKHYIAFQTNNGQINNLNDVTNASVMLQSITNYYV